jgi:hypothetical protein
MFRLALVTMLLLSCVCGRAERIPFLVREHADTLAVETHGSDTCAVSEGQLQEQLQDTVNAVVKEAGIEPVTREQAPRALRLMVSAGCLRDGGATLLVRFLDDVKGTMITHLNTRVDTNSSALLLDAVRTAIEEAIVDYVDSNPELSRH